MTTVRWGILSAARIAKDWVCPGIHNSAEGVVAAVASLTPGKADTIAAPYGARVHASYEALLADPDIDVIYIPLPNNGHVEWTKKALNAGKHVLTEKPLALAAAEIDDLIALRDRTGRFAAEAFMVTHHPQWHRVRALLADGVIGKLCHVQGGFSFFNDDPANIRNDASLDGGALRDIGVYPAVSTRFVTGAEPVRIQSRITWDRGIDSTARIWAEFPEFTMDFYVSMRMHPYQQMHFHGDKGWIKVMSPFNAKSYGDDVIEIRTEDDATRLERFPRVDHYERQATAFHDTILRGAPYDCTLEFSRGNQRMIDMIYAGDVAG